MVIYEFVPENTNEYVRIPNDVHNNYAHMIYIFSSQGISDT